MEIKGNLNGRINIIISLIALAGAYIWVISYHLICGERMLDSDMSSEMILADILNKEHSVTGITRSWLYSTEIHIFEMQWFYRLGLSLFPNNWHYARTFGMALALFMYAMIIIFVFYAIGYAEAGIWAAAFSILPGGSWYFWQTIYGGYYLAHQLMTLFPLALVLLLVRENLRSKKIICFVLLMLVSLASGIKGIKLLMTFYMPLCVTAIIVFFLAGKLQWKTVKRLNLMLISIIATISAVIGYIINSKVLAKIYSFESFSAMTIGVKSYFDLLRDYIWSFGYAEGKILMSPQGIAAMCGVVFGIIVLVSGVRLVIRIADLPEEIAVLTVFCTASIVTITFVFSYVAREGGIQYYQILVPLGYFLVVMEIATERTVFQYSKLCLMLMALVLVLCASAGTVYNEDHEPYHVYRAHTQLKPVVDMLVEQGYTDGVSMFWTSNIITELSNGKIDMWTINLDFPGEWFPWLQRSDHIGREPEGRYFYLYDFTFDDVYLDDKILMGAQYVHDHPTPKPLELIYADGNYVVYGN